jgi:hypothetical protein
VLADILLETKWSWQEWEQTPVYIRNVMVVTVQARRRAENDRAERQQAEMEAARRHGQ